MDEEDDDEEERRSFVSTPPAFPYIRVRRKANVILSWPTDPGQWNTEYIP